MSGVGTRLAPPGFDVGEFGIGALAESWAQAGKSAMQVQAGRMVAEAMKATPGMGGGAPAFAALAPDRAELRRELRALKRQGQPAPAAAAALLRRYGGAGQAEGGPPA